MLRKIIKELADGGGAVGMTSANAIAGVRGALFGGETKQAQQKTKSGKKRKVIIKRMMEAEDSANISDVFSKMKTAKKSSQTHKSAVKFGMEDELGNIIKVYVAKDQADDFEKALSQELHDEKKHKLDVSEILFKLKDDFNIVDVEWPPLGEDEEVTTTEPSPETSGTEDSGGDLSMSSDSESEDSGDKEDITADNQMSDEVSDMKSTLQVIISMLKADADAKKSEAEARKAEAEKEISKYAAQAAESKLKAEEEILDMEEFYRDQERRERESRRLGKLAKYRHEKAGWLKTTAQGISDITDKGEEQSKLDKEGPTVQDVKLSSAMDRHDEDEEESVKRIPSGKYLSYVKKQLKKVQ